MHGGEGVLVGRPRRWNRHSQDKDTAVSKQDNSASASDVTVPCIQGKATTKGYRFLFVGNSNTYQPKELGGVPQAVARLVSAVSGSAAVCDSVVQGGADLCDLWTAVEGRLESGDLFDVVVLQVDAGNDVQTQFAVSQVLQKRYAPLILAKLPSSRVLLYQTWLGPNSEDGQDQLNSTATVYQSALLTGGLSDVCVARVGFAFLALRESATADEHVYPALWKDDSGHPSALAGVFIAAVIVLALGFGTGPRAASLEQILETMIPSAWRTASPAFLGLPSEVAQKGWHFNKGGLSEFLPRHGEDDSLTKYPEGMRTERRMLGLAPGRDLLQAAVASLAVHCNGRHEFSDVSSPHVDILGGHQNLPEACIRSRSSLRWCAR